MFSAADSRRACPMMKNRRAGAERDPIESLGRASPVPAPDRRPRRCSEEVLSLRSVMTTRDTLRSGFQNLDHASCVRGQRVFLAQDLHGMASASIGRSRWVARGSPRLVEEDHGTLGALIDGEAAHADRNQCSWREFVLSGGRRSRSSESGCPGMPTDGGGRHAPCSGASTFAGLDQSELGTRDEALERPSGIRDTSSSPRVVNPIMNAACVADLSSGYSRTTCWKRRFAPGGSRACARARDPPLHAPEPSRSGASPASHAVLLL